MPRVLCTGASGLIGRHCLPLLAHSGFEVHAVGRGFASNTAEMQWHSADLLDPSAADALLDCVKPTHLLHLAWYTAPGAFWSAPENRVWLEASLTLFRKFEQSGGRRIVAAGTCAEYDWNSGACDELTTPCKPGSLYGRTKLAAAEYLNALHSTELSTAWARLFFLYGPDASTRRMPGVVISALSRAEPVECSAGTQQRDFLYVPDAAEAIVTLLASDVTGPVNVCSGIPISIRDLALKTAELMGRPDLLRLGAIGNTSTEPPLVVGNTSRLANELNWKPRFSLEEGLSETVGLMTRTSLARSA